MSSSKSLHLFHLLFLFFREIRCEIDSSSKVVVLGCSVLDHLACDEICKSDNFWYGHCSFWDGRDFRCKCYEYQKPLDGLICEQMQQHCMRACQSKKDGGYCYPQPDPSYPRGKPQCRCFERLPEIEFSAV